MSEYYKCVRCHENWEHSIPICFCGGTLKPVVKLRAIHSGDVDRELGYKSVYVPNTGKPTPRHDPWLRSNYELQGDDSKGRLSVKRPA